MPRAHLSACRTLAALAPCCLQSTTLLGSCWRRWGTLLARMAASAAAAKVAAAARARNDERTARQLSLLQVLSRSSRGRLQAGSAPTGIRCVDRQFRRHAESRVVHQLFCIRSFVQAQAALCAACVHALCNCCPTGLETWLGIGGWPHAPVLMPQATLCVCRWRTGGAAKKPWPGT